MQKKERKVRRGRNKKKGENIKRRWIYGDLDRDVGANQMERGGKEEEEGGRECVIEKGGKEEEKMRKKSDEREGGGVI